VDVIRVGNESELTELVTRIMAGDSTAEEEVVLRYKRGIGIIIDQIVRNPTAAEDVSQDTFRIVLEKIRHGDLREPARLSGFVCGVARNAAIEYIRRAKRLKNMDPIGEGQQIADSAPSQLDQMLKQERAAIVRQIIHELKVDRDRDLLLRYYIAEEDKDTICADLNITRAQFSNVIFRAIARFKELYLRRTGDS
jgi:RNA polymerase sigma-70 factor, ECF subfamily